MTRVCLVGTDDANLQYELLSRETARDALAAYDLKEPYENTIAVETVSLGAAVALCNDLQWYLVRFVEDCFILDPSITETEWLSRQLATDVRNGTVEASDTGRFLRIYGVVRDGDDEEPGDQSSGPPVRLVEPMLVTRTDDQIPEYDLREVDDTLIVRVSEAEFGA